MQGLTPPLLPRGGSRHVLLSRRCRCCGSVGGVCLSAGVGGGSAHVAQFCARSRLFWRKRDLSCATEDAPGEKVPPAPPRRISMIVWERSECKRNARRLPPSAQTGCKCTARATAKPQRLPLSSVITPGKPMHAIKKPITPPADC